MTSNKWIEKFINLAEHISSWSKDPSTKVGCVIVGPNKEIRSTGYNGFPTGIKDDERLNDKQEKYKLVVHAEQNAISFAALNGVSLKDCTIYVTHAPCTECAKLIIQSGIKKVVHKEYAKNWLGGKEILEEAGIKIQTR